MIRSTIWIGTFLLAFVSLTQAQSIKPIQTGLIADSSYYDLAQVGFDEYWAVGENGIIKSLDSKGNVQHISFPFSGVNLLKVVANEDYVFIGADQGQVFRYDKQSGDFIRSYYGKKFQKRCFYDLLLMEDGSLLLAGGNQKIAKAGKALPHGFIAKADADLLLEPEIVWSNPLQFVWSLLEPVAGGQEYLAAVYGGFQTTIFSSITEGKTWQRKSHIPALVHHLDHQAGAVVYSGSKNFFFKRNGVIGSLGGHQTLLKDEGCVWSVAELGGEQIAVTNDGSVIQYEETAGLEIDHLRPAATSIYEAVAVDEDKLLVAGHGRLLFLIDLQAETDAIMSTARK
jgi:hypothetical protein